MLDGMKFGPVFAVLLAVGLAGCAPQAKEVSTETEVRSKLGAVGVKPTNEVPWDAWRFVAADLPMDGLWSDALADPFSQRQQWSLPAGSKDRAVMLQQLGAYREAVLAAKPTAGEDPASASMFYQQGVSALVLRSRLLALEGKLPEAVAAAKECLEIAGNSVTTGVGLQRMDSAPGVLLAAEQAVQLSREPGVTVAQREELAKVLAGISFRAQITEAVQAEFASVGVDRLVATTRVGADAEDHILTIISRGAEIDLMKEKLLDHRAEVQELYSQEATIELTRDWATKLAQVGEAGWMDLETQVMAMRGALQSAWGMDPFEVAPEDWQADRIRDAMRQHANAGGIAVAWDLVAAMVPSVESAFLTDASLQAAIASLLSPPGAKVSESELRKRFAAITGRELIDPLTGQPSVVDGVNRVLRTPRSEPLPENFLLMRAYQQGGLPY
jgi:hypothetical protein